MVEKKEKSPATNNIAFVKEVAKYFMDFLETDFHKRRNPKRSIQFRSNNNLLIGLNLQKYPTFNALVNKAINHGFSKQILNNIPKGAYRTVVPANLIDLVKLQVEKISGKQISQLLVSISREIEKAATTYNKEFDKALSAAREGSALIIKKNLVLPFITEIEKPLQNLNIGDENNIYLMEEELTAILSTLIEIKVSETLKLFIAKEKVDFTKQLKTVFELNDIKSNIISFFKDLQVGDCKSFASLGDFA